MAAGSDGSGFGNPHARDRSSDAIRAAFRRKWTLVGTLIILFGLAIGVLLAHSTNVRTERAMTQSYLAAQDAFEDELEAYQKQLENLQSIELAKDLRPDHGKSTPLFKEFADKYASHPLGWQAALRVAQESIKDKDFDEAISRLEPILPRTRSFPIMQVKIRDTLAGLYAEKGDFSKALAEISIIEKISENPAPDQTLLRKAQFLYLSGDKDGARQLLGQIAEGRVGDRVVASDVSLEASTWVDFWDLKP